MHYLLGSVYGAGITEEDMEVRSFRGLHICCWLIQFGLGNSAIWINPSKFLLACAVILFLQTSVCISA